MRRRKKGEPKLRRRENRILLRDVGTTAVEPAYGSITFSADVQFMYLPYVFGIEL